MNKAYAGALLSSGFLSELNVRQAGLSVGGVLWR